MLLQTCVVLVPSRRAGVEGGIELGEGIPVAELINGVLCSGILF